MPVGQNPRLLVRQQQLTPYTHRVPGNAILALLSQDMDVAVGAITGAQVGLHRASYINAILIQSQGGCPQRPVPSVVHRDLISVPSRLATTW